MKRIIIILFISFIWLCSCKKDYPKDVPDWVEDTIKECKRNRCCDDHNIVYHINEYADTLGNIVYGIYRGGDGDYDETYYTIFGSYICIDIYNGGTIDYECYRYAKTLIFQRLIWEESCAYLN